MKVFVTGGTGLVGRHVIAQLTARGDGVVALARSDAAASALGAAGASVVRGDLTAGALPADVLAAARACDGIVHAAAVVMSRRPWEHFRATNVAPTIELARLAAAAGCRLVHLSSVAVYGRRTTYEGGTGSVTEDFGMDRPLFAGDHYARSKREAEQALWRVADETGLRAAALRPCVIYGEGDRHFVRRVARLLRTGWAPIVGDGTNALGVVYAGNVAGAVLAALDRPQACGAFNVANDGVVTQREFLTHFAEGLGVRLRIVPVPRALAWGGATAADAVLRLVRPGAPMTLLKVAVQFLANPNPYVSRRACDELGWSPAVPPREALRRTARAHRD